MIEIVYCPIIYQGMFKAEYLSCMQDRCCTGFAFSNPVSRITECFKISINYWVYKGIR